MLAYFILVGGTFTVSLLSYQFRKRSGITEKKNYEVIVFFAIMIVLLALRAEGVGSDTERYIYLYKQVRTESISTILSSETEFGYRLAEKLFSYLFSDPRGFLAFHALVTVVPIAYLYYKEADLPLVALMMFMALPTFHMAFSGMRQMVAIAFFVPAYYMVRKKKLIFFLLLVFAAFFFHQSAIFMLLLYPIYHLSVKVASFAVVLPTIVFVFIYNAVIYKWIVRFLPEKFIERYSDIKDTGGYTVLIMFILLVILCFFLVRAENLDKDTVGLRNVVILSAILQCFAPINSIAMRVNYYYFVLVPIAISKIINRTEEDKRPFGIAAALGIAAVMLFMFFYKGFTGQDGFEIFPYYTFLG